jgi:hypothetical protein
VQSTVLGRGASVIDKISTYDDKKLAVIEENATRLARVGTGTQKTHAESVLNAISDERQRRKEAAADRCRQQAAEIAEKVKGMKLLDRVLLAFTEVPPEECEVEVLTEIAAHPGSDGTTIARGIGKQDGVYINLAVGKLCSTREPYLGIAPVVKRRKGEKHFSALLIDFTPNVDPNGSRWFSWTLKPEAHAALKQLGIVT